MVIRCVVYGCDNSAGPLISVHWFPKDKKLRQLWVNFVKNTRKWEAKQVSIHVGVCSAHFEDDCFLNKLQASMGLAQRLLLKKDAVPTIYPEGTSRTSAASDSSQQTHQRSAARKREVQRVSMIILRAVYRLISTLAYLL